MQGTDTIGNKQDVFRELYQAHDKIRTIKEKIDRLYQSAQYVSPVMTSMPKPQPNPKRLEDAIIEIANLRELGEKVLRRRALFDEFIVSQLSINEEAVLSFRCEKNMSWNGVAASLNLGVTTVKGIYNVVEKKADKFGLFCTEKSD